jgi:hypothetical protein
MELFMKLVKLLTVAVLGVSFIGANSVMGAPARPDGNKTKTSVKSGHHKKHGKKHAKGHKKHSSKKHHKTSKPA